MNFRQRIPLFLIAVGVLALSLALVGGTVWAQSPPPPDELTAEMLPTTVRMSSTHFVIDWSVIATGGSVMTSTHFNLSATIGQNLTGTQNSTSFGSCSGFWCGIGDFIRKLFLPLTLQND